MSDWIKECERFMEENPAKTRFTRVAYSESLSQLWLMIVQSKYFEFGIN